MSSDRNVSQLLALSLAKQENKKFIRCFCKAKGSGELFPGEDVLRVQSSLNVSPFQPSGMFKTIVSSPVFGALWGLGAVVFSFGCVFLFVWVLLWLLFLFCVCCFWWLEMIVLLLEASNRC